MALGLARSLMATMSMLPHTTTPLSLFESGPSRGAVGAMSLDEAEGMFDDAEEDEEEGGGPVAGGGGAVDAAEVARRERAAQLEAKELQLTEDLAAVAKAEDH